MQNAFGIRNCYLHCFVCTLTVTLDAHTFARVTRTIEATAAVRGSSTLVMRSSIDIGDATKTLNCTMVRDAVDVAEEVAVAVAVAVATEVRV